MPRNDGRLEPGQPLAGAISARAWNRMADAADLVMGDALGIAGSPQSTSAFPFMTLLCRNANSGDLWPGYPVETKGLIVPSNAQLSDSFPYRSFDVLTPPVLLVDRPSSSTAIMPDFGVVIEPIKAGQFGRVAFSGVVPACVKFEQQSESCSFVAGGDGFCIAYPYGCARIIYRTRVPINAVVQGSPWFEYCYIILNRATYSSTVVAQYQDVEPWALGEVKTVSPYPFAVTSTLDARNDLYPVIEPESRVSLRLGEDNVWQVIGAGRPQVSRTQIAPSIPLTGTW